ncbi:invasion associated locus B family protein [Pseudoxanthobacter sp. M-2]|uniref:invasion associated locus B family protein n=1 Tax=Pseudoxanthobacter sp. M-2 TaxID=3078754 RepID=UPI0038FC7400
MTVEFLQMRGTARILSAIGGAAMLVAGALAPAQAQDAAPATSTDALLQADLEWIKLCNQDPQANKQVCLINQELRTDEGQFLASVAIREIEGESRKVLLIAVPPAMLIQPGLRVQVDGGKQEQARYSICFPNACYAEMVVTDAIIAQFKKGNQLVLTTLNQQAKPVNFPISLSGFTKIYDGPPIDADALQARQDKLESELQARAEEARNRLIEEQRKATQSTTAPQ